MTRDIFFCRAEWKYFTPLPFIRLLNHVHTKVLFPYLCVRIDSLLVWLLSPPSFSLSSSDSPFVFSPSVCSFSSPLFAFRIIFNTGVVQSLPCICIPSLTHHQWAFLVVVHTPTIFSLRAQFLPLSAIRTFLSTELFLFVPSSLCALVVSMASLFEFSWLFASLYAPSSTTVMMAPFWNEVIQWYSLPSLSSICHCPTSPPCLLKVSLQCLQCSFLPYSERRYSLSTGSAHPKNGLRRFPRFRYSLFLSAAPVF